jgi:hypothetical protein
MQYGDPFNRIGERANDPIPVTPTKDIGFQSKRDA